MAKPSKLTPAQWEEVKKKHIVDGIPLRQLEKEYPVSEAAIRKYLAKGSQVSSQDGSQRFANAKERVDTAAKKAIEAVRTAGVEPNEVGMALELAVKMESVKSNLSRAASNTSSVADIISVLAKRSADKLALDQSGMIDLDDVKQVGALIELTNRASYIGLESVKLNKDAPGHDKPKEGAVKFYIPSNGR